MKTWALASLILAGGVLAAPAGAATIYQNDFETSSTANITGGVLTTAPNTQKYLGELAAGSQADLSLTGLAANSVVSFSFDLYTVNSLDGDGTDFCCGPDPFKLTFNGTTLLDATFTNNAGWHQSFPVAGSLAGTGSDPLLTGALGYNNFGPDHTYHLSFTNLNIGAATSVLISFIGNSNQSWSDEGFGIDNILVTTLSPSTVPVPAALPLFASGLAAFGWIGAKRRRKAVAHVA